MDASWLPKRPLVRFDGHSGRARVKTGLVFVEIDRLGRSKGTSVSRDRKLERTTGEDHDKIVKRQVPSLSSNISRTEEE